MTNEGDTENLRSRINLKKTIKALGTKARDELETQLNHKIYIKKTPFYPDWRGFFEILNLPEKYHQKVANSIDPTSEILNLWCKIDPENSTVEKLFACLEQIERYGLIEDLEELICEDLENFNNYTERPPESRNRNTQVEKYVVTAEDVAKINEGRNLERYDGFVLFADDDEDDINFTANLIETMQTQYNLKLCIKDDLIPGDLEYTSIITLITERCNRLIVILSPAFFKSRMHQFYMSYAQYYGVETQRTRVIHCIHKKCLEMPPSLMGFYMLDYTRVSKLWNFWQKLRDSLTPIDPDGAEKFLASRSTSAIKPPDHRATSSTAEEHDVTGRATVTVSDQNQNIQALNISGSSTSHTLPVQETTKKKPNFFKIGQQDKSSKKVKTKTQETEDNNVCTTEEVPPTTNNKSESLLSIPRILRVFKRDTKNRSNNGSTPNDCEKPVKSKKKKGKEKIAVAAS